MNVLKSGEQMLKRAILSGRFSLVWTQYCPLPYKRPDPIPYCRNCTVPSFHQNSTRTLCSVLPSKDAASDLSRSNEEEHAPFFKMLAECRSPSDVLDLVDSREVYHLHISYCMSQMWKSIKKMSEDQRRCEISLMLAHPSFQKLCHKARVGAPCMSTSQLAYTLSSMVKLGVSQSSVVVQTLLRVMQERLNQLDEKSLSILCYTLKQMESSKNSDALTQGLKLILPEWIPKIQNVIALQNVMCLLGKDTPPVIKKNLQMKALSMADEFTLPNAQHMMRTLATIDLHSKPLLDIFSKRIAENIYGVPYPKMLMVLKSCRELFYRNSNLLSSISDYLATTLSIWSNKQIIFFLLEFEALCFNPVALLDAFAERVIQKPHSFALKDLFSILKIYSSLNHDLKEHKQEFLDGVTLMLESYLPRMTSVQLLRAVSFLCVFGHFPQVLLKKLLQKECLDELLQRGGTEYIGVMNNLHKLDLCLRLDNPPLPPSVSPLPDLHNVLQPNENRLHPRLISALKNLAGEDAVMESVVEANVYFIDAVITLSEAKDILSSPEEHSVTSQNSRRIAVLCVRSHAFCFGTTHPRSMLAMKIRHLKLLGYEPCLVGDFSTTSF
uniref:FAST kinase leucine-rich domain-containing protein n=1 Tax=Astyanax mexicanus TaxID=7994 RepID=A0A8B9KVU1_ASTMX